jgi:hypothetical protein
VNGGDDEQIPGEPIWRPPTGKPYDWAKERGYPKFPRSWDWEEIVFTLLAAGAVGLAIWLLSGL